MYVFSVIFNRIVYTWSNLPGPDFMKQTKVREKKLQDYSFFLWMVKIKGQNWVAASYLDETKDFFKMSNLSSFP